MRAQEFLGHNELEPEEEVNCKKFPIDAEGLEARLKDIEQVLVSKGKKLLDLHPESDKEEILQVAIGRSGNLRAPSLQHGKLLIVGFHEDAYHKLC